MPGPPAGSSLPTASDPSGSLQAERSTSGRAAVPPACFDLTSPDDDPPMARIPFEELPADARIWIFSSDRPLEPGERERIEGAVDGFLQTWNAHGTPLRGSREWRYDRFLLVGVDEAAAPPSGCSIDALVRVFKELERDLDVALLDRSFIWYRDEDRIRCVTRPEFRELAEEGAVGPDTVVFDGALTRMEELRNGAWEVRVRDSWHRQLLK